MNLGCLVTLASHPADVYLLVVDNGVYEVTGGQPTPGAGRTDFAALARAAGIPRVYAFDTLPAWQSGLLMMPTALAAMVMKLIAPRLLRQFGYRQVLVVNTLMIGVTIGLFALIDIDTPLAVIVMLGLAQGFFNSLQFSSMNTMAYADIEPRDSSMASTIASSLQQLSASPSLRMQMR